MRALLFFLIFTCGFIAGVNMPPQPNYIPELWRVFASIVFAILFILQIFAKEKCK